MEVWLVIELGVLFTGVVALLSGCADPKEETGEVDWDEIGGNSEKNDAWNEIMDAVNESEVQQEEPCTIDALVSCTSAIDETETVHMVSEADNVKITDIAQLSNKDIIRETAFSGCRLSADNKCTLDKSYIEGAEWQECDENYDLSSGKNSLSCNSSYMLCQYGHGIIYFKDAGQLFKDYVQEQAENRFLITLDILQEMKVHDTCGNAIALGVKEIASYDVESLLPIYKEARDFTQKDVDEINRVLYKYEINTPDKVAHFLAQCTAESNLGEAPLEKFDGDVLEYFKMYDPGTKKGEELGNTQEKDGARFRGSGAIHITGRATYTAFSGYVNDNKITKDGALYVGQNYFWESAGYYWSVYKDLNHVCESTDEEKVNVSRITAIVNGGNNQLDLREQAYLYLITKLKSR